ncbi:MAG: MFS transporter [Myxococcaceae bacterium]
MKPAQTRKGFARLVAASLAGTTIEFYDFFLYGTAAALVFNKVFFPAGDPLTGILMALGTYAVGFVARPVGGIVFGHLGDRWGRRNTLALSLLLMGAATVGIGLIPSYETIGIAAPILLTVLRLVQGLALGGEWGGAVLLVAEHGSDKHRGFWSSFPQTGGPIGNMIATLVLAVLGTVITNEQFVDWGWRVAFLLSAVLVFAGIWLRRSIEESPLFLEMQARAKARGTEGHAPIKTVLREYRREVALAAMANVGEKATYYTFSIFLLTYLTQQVQVSRSVALTAVSIASVPQILAMLAGGTLSDRFGRQGLNILLGVLVALWGFLGLPLVDTGNSALITVVIVVGLTLHGLMCGGQVAFYAEIFPSHVRYTGASLGYQLATVIGGSLAPIIGVALLRHYGSTTPVAIFLALCAASTVLAFVLAGETRHRSLRHAHAEPTPAPEQERADTEVQPG